MPTTLADLFEFFAACDIDPLHDTSSTLWRLLSYLQLSDLLSLRQICKSSYQLVTV